MAENTKIEWCDHTFNPWIGCTKVSEGCQFCYAEALMDKRYGKVEWGPQGVRVRTSEANWKKPFKWNREAKEKGIRYRVFCASLADVFEEKPDQPELDEWRADLFDLIVNTPHLDWLLLTKRPENVNHMIERVTGFSDAEMWFYALDNVWVGTSVENQEQADLRIPHLLAIPAAVRFLSMEPLLGPVDLFKFMNYVNETDDIGLTAEGFDPEFHWVIVGGESGQNARPMHPDWVRSIRDQCNAAGVPFFFKQWGEWAPTGQREDGERYATIMRPWLDAGDSQAVLKIGKKRAGRLLDGRPWDEFPTTETTQ